jgi:signal transduction histidine kinase
MSLDRLKQFTWIYDLNRLAQKDLETEVISSVYQRVLQHIVEGFEADSGSLSLLSHDDNCLTIVACVDLPKGVIGKRIPLGDGILGWVVKEDTPLLLNGDASSDSRVQQHQKKSGTVSDMSSMCWPLKIEANCIGGIAVNRSLSATLGMDRTNDRSPFSEADLKMGSALLNMVSLALGNIQLHIEQKRRVDELQQLNQKLKETQSHLMQADKLASIGQLAAGVAHEINNPIGFVYSNLGTLSKYIQNIFDLLDAYERTECALADKEIRACLQIAKKKSDIEFMKEDLQALIDESKDGITRVKTIVQSLKDFSHVDDTDAWQHSNLHHNLDSTLNIVNNEIKYKAEVIKEYGNIPEVECLPSQLNQVFMNLLVNAAHAIEQHGTITLRSGQKDGKVWVEISDTGNGIAPEHMQKIFDPFFTTKPIGQGTGLGLSLSYGIVQKHHGNIEVKSELGKGTTFRVWLPIIQPYDGSE